VRAAACREDNPLTICSNTGAQVAIGDHEVNNMDNSFPALRSDVVAIQSVARPTPAPVRVSFGDVLAKGASTLASGAEAAMDALPGGPLVAAAIRGVSAASAPPPSPLMAGGLNATTPEGPAALSNMSVGGGVTGGTSGVPAGSIDSSLQQSQEMNLYFLQIQQQVNTQNDTFTTLSNVMKTEADTVKNAIGNLH
jgi:hypothetical protein